MKLAEYFLAISHSDYAKWRQNRCTVILQKPIVIITALWNISPTPLKHFLYRQGINIFVSIPVQLHWHLPFKKTHYPLPCTTFLPPLSKERCCRPKKFGRLPEELPHRPSLRITFQNRTIPRKSPTPLPLNERSVGFAVPLPSTITLASPRKRGGGLTALQNRYST